MANKYVERSEKQNSGVCEMKPSLRVLIDSLCLVVNGMLLVNGLHTGGEPTYNSIYALIIVWSFLGLRAVGKELDSFYAAYTEEEPK